MALFKLIHAVTTSESASNTAVFASNAARLLTSNLAGSNASFAGAVGVAGALTASNLTGSNASFAGAVTLARGPLTVGTQGLGTGHGMAAANTTGGVRWYKLATVTESQAKAQFRVMGVVSRTHETHSIDVTMGTNNVGNAISATVKWDSAVESGATLFGATFDLMLVTETSDKVHLYAAMDTQMTFNLQVFAMPRNAESTHSTAFYAPQDSTYTLAMDASMTSAVDATLVGAVATFRVSAVASYLRVGVDGSVGVLTTAPGAPLDVAGNAIVRASLTASNVVSSNATFAGPVRVLAANVLTASNLAGSNASFAGAVGVAGALSAQNVVAASNVRAQTAFLTSGNLPVQLAFGWNGGTQYAHAIRTGHQSSVLSPQENSFEFYLWHPGQAADERGDRLAMAATAVGVGVLVNPPTAALDVGGAAVVRSNLLVGGTATCSNATFAGLVGVATDAPLAPLHVVSSNASGVSILASHDIVAASDARLKHDVRPIDRATERLRTLSGYTYARAADSAARFAGLIAQEVQAALPEVVHADPSGSLAVAYGNFAALLVQGFKELDARLSAQEAAAGAGSTGATFP